MKPTRTAPCTICGQLIRNRKDRIKRHFLRKHPMEEESGIQPSLTPIRHTYNPLVDIGS